MIRKYFSKIDNFILMIIGFLLAFPIGLVAVNSLSIIPEFKTALIIGLLVWFALHLTKPIHSYIAGAFLMIQFAWFFSIGSILPYYLQNGFLRIFPGSLGLSEFIYKYLGGEWYYRLIYYFRELAIERTKFMQPEYYVVLAWLLLSIMVFIIYLIDRRSDWRVFLMGCLYFVVAWFLYVSKISLYFSIYFIGLTGYMQYANYEMMIVKAQKTKEGTKYYRYANATRFGVFLMTSLVLISSFIMLFVPLDEIKSKLSQVVPITDFYRNDFELTNANRIFSFSSTMYAPNNNILGGPIEERDYTLLMQVKALNENLYLRGRVKNEYDGKQWVSTFDRYYNNVNHDLIVPEEHLSTIIVYPDNIETKTIFSPYKYYDSSYSTGRVYGNEDSIVYRKRGFERNSYEVRYIDPEYTGIYDTLPTGLKQAYLTLPENGLDRTRVLTKRLTDGLEPYEQMKALERYLREHYKYTLKPMPPDEARDFVDHFLFVEKEGYCTYFATTLAVMGRVADIPTRYVEGFLTSANTNYNGFFEVTADRAHAWTEAYIEGQGWVRFEATPVYDNGDVVEEEEIVVSQNQNTDSEPVPEGPNVFEEEFVERTPTTSTFPVKDILMFVMYIALIIGVIVGFVYRFKKLKSDVNDGDENEKIRRRIFYMLSMCRLIDNDLDETYLPVDIIKQGAKILSLETDDQVTSIIQQSLYSKKTFDPTDFETLDKYFKSFDALVKLKLTRIGYFIHKVLLNTLYHRDYYDHV